MVFGRFVTSGKAVNKKWCGSHIVFIQFSGLGQPTQQIKRQFHTIYAAYSALACSAIHYRH